MKKVIFPLVIIGIFATNSDASVLTVSNDAKAPAQYTIIDDAVTAASVGDTILVYGSASSYGNVNIDRKVVLMGAGYNNPYNPNSTIGTIYLNDGSGALVASNTKISGFVIGSIMFNLNLQL